MVNDSLGDFLTRIRNASKAKHETTFVAYSRLNEAVAQVLKANGFVSDVQTAEKDGHKKLAINLKYNSDGSPIIDYVGRVSKPGHRIYSGAPKTTTVRSGLGFRILSTPLGVLTDAQAREKNVGGEVLAEIW